MRALKNLLLGSAAVVAVAAVALVGIKSSRDRTAAPLAHRAPHRRCRFPLPAVVKRTIPIYLEYSARTESIRSVPLLPKISGYIQSQATPDGADVKEHDLLYKIDERDYRAALDQAQAQAQRDAAAVDYARSNYGRGDELAKSGFLSKDSFDQRASTLRQSEAAVAMDNAAIRSAENNLDYTEIRAPFAGRLGRNNAPIGTLVGAGAGALNTLVQLDPIYVTFNPSEGDLTQIETARRSGAAKAQVTLPGGGGSDHFGELTFVDNAVDRTTGTIAARATIDNKDFMLLPGSTSASASTSATRPMRCWCRRWRSARASSASTSTWSAPTARRSRSSSPPAPRRTPGQRQRPERDRPGDRRQPAEDRPRRTGAATAAEAGRRREVRHRVTAPC